MGDRWVYLGLLRAQVSRSGTDALMKNRHQETFKWREVTSGSQFKSPKKKRLPEIFGPLCRLPNTNPLNNVENRRNLRKWSKFDLKFVHVQPPVAQLSGSLRRVEATPAEMLPIATALTTNPQKIIAGVCQEKNRTIVRMVAEGKKWMFSELL